MTSFPPRVCRPEINKLPLVCVIDFIPTCQIMYTYLLSNSILLCFILHNLATLNIVYDIIFTFNKKKGEKKIWVWYTLYFFKVNLNKCIKKIAFYQSKGILIRDSEFEAFVQNIDLYRQTQGCLFNSVTFIPLHSLFDSGITINLFSKKKLTDFYAYSNDTHFPTLLHIIIIRKK